MYIINKILANNYLVIIERFGGNTGKSDYGFIIYSFWGKYMNQVRMYLT